MNRLLRIRNRCGAMLTLRTFSLAALCLLVVGCGERRAGPVNVEVARATLIDVLNHWKNGGTVDELRQTTPAIVVQEALWTNGGSLDAFEIAEQGRTEDANWYCEVELTVSPKDGGPPIRKKVTYVVGTDPVLTVFHAIL